MDPGGLPEMNSLHEGLDKASAVTDNISGYAEDAKNISAGNARDLKQIDKDILAKVEMDELSALKENEQLLNAHKEMISSLKNQQQYKEKILAKAREVVAEQMAAEQRKITEAVDKLSKHQKRAGTVFSKVKGLPKRPRKEKRPPFIERFVPGVTLQVQKADGWFIDLNPSLRYRLKSIFSAGIGWNERVALDNDFRAQPKSRIYGIRSFFELSVLKGLWIRADVERMNAFVPVNKTQQDIGERSQVWSYLAGIKKEFSFSPRVVGNVQFLYNLHNPEQTSPYFNKFNVRFGFDFPLKAKKQP